MWIGNATIITGANATFNLKDKEFSCSNLLYSTRIGGIDNIYILNGKYSRLTGKSVIPYTTIGSNSTGVLKFFSVENDGTQTEIAKYDLKQTEDPIDIDVNLKGVVNLRIYAYCLDSYSAGQTKWNNPALYDITLFSE